MKRTTRLIALLCALVLLAALAGCGKDPPPTPNPTPTPEYEMIAVTMPERQPGEATEKIIKAVNSLSGVWALSENHNLYRMQLENNEPDMSTMEVAYQNVQDFTRPADWSGTGPTMTTASCRSRWRALRRFPAVRR